MKSRKGLREPLIPSVSYLCDIPESIVTASKDNIDTQLNKQHIDMIFDIYTYI